MKGEWCFFKSYLDAKTCDSIVNVITKRPAQESTIGTADGIRPDSSYRRSNII
jgi:hypothetical protein